MPIVKTANSHIYYESCGDGSAVVFMHGFLCDRTLFKHQVTALQGSHRVINMDLRGHGRSGDCEAAFTMYDLVNDVLAVLDAEAIPVATWVGLSMGGFIALTAALTQPERVQALVLIDTEAGRQSGMKKVQDLALKLALKTVGPRYVVSSIMAAMLGKTSMSTRPALVDEYRRRFLSMRVNSVCKSIDAVMRREDLVGRLHKIRCPTLVVVGEEDRSLPVAKSQVIADEVPGALLMVIASAGHLSAVEQPQAVNEALCQFLQRLERSIY